MSGPLPLSRRHLLAATLGGLLPVARADVEFPRVVPRPLTFPADFGAHPDFRTEWWYLTGWLRPGPAPLGFQLTFFRVRTPVDPANPSRFTATQLLIAHGALADPARGGLVHDERLARAGFGIVGATTGDTAVRLDDWSLRRDAADHYQGVMAARTFRLEFEARPPGPPLLQGDGGFSCKGPEPAQASHYYSRPQLAVTAELERDGRREVLTGRAWLDHEWSSTLLAPEAEGWDWVGMNLSDGGSLTAFQIRSAARAAPVWAYAQLVGPDGSARQFGPDEVLFAPRRRWTSPRTRAAWPVAQAIRVGPRRFHTEPLMDDQELDSRATTGAVYWEGASRLLEHDSPVGEGYLEMTGYVSPLRLP